MKIYKKQLLPKTLNNMKKKLNRPKFKKYKEIKFNNKNQSDKCKLKKMLELFKLWLKPNKKKQLNLLKYNINKEFNKKNFREKNCWNILENKDLFEQVV